MVANVLKDYGSGGGHREMAGGFIPKENMDRIDGMHARIEEEFMKQIQLMKQK